MQMSEDHNRHRTFHTHKWPLVRLYKWNKRVGMNGGLKSGRKKVTADSSWVSLLVL